MSKALVVALGVFALAGGGLLLMSSQPKAGEVPEVTETADCVYPEDQDCPLTEEQKQLLNEPHAIDEDILNLIEAE